MIEEVIDTPRENLYTLHNFKTGSIAQRITDSEPVLLTERKIKMGSLKGGEPKKKAKKKAAPKKAAKKKAAKKK